MKIFLRSFLVLLLAGNCYSCFAQIAVQGKVFDISQKIPLEGVSVLSTSGQGISSDSLGRYKLVLAEKDSIWFSYQGKSTPRYAVRTIPNPLTFDVSIQVKSDVLPTITVWKHSYKFDSLSNRENYAKIFNYNKPSFGTSIAPPNSGAVGVGLDLGALINMFSFKKNKRMLSLQERLIEEEQEKYIDYRYSKSYVRRLTELTGEEMDLFMKMYRPGIEFVRIASEAEMGIYILECFKDYKAGRKTPKEAIQIRVIQYEF